MMTYAEFQALENLLEYIKADNWFYGDSDKLADILRAYIYGHHSTETKPKEEGV